MKPDNKAPDQATSPSVPIKSKVAPLQPLPNESAIRNDTPDNPSSQTTSYSHKELSSTLARESKFIAKVSIHPSTIIVRQEPSSSVAHPSNSK